MSNDSPRHKTFQLKGHSAKADTSCWTRSSSCAVPCTTRAPRKTRRLEDATRLHIPHRQDGTTHSRTHRPARLGRIRHHHRTRRPLPPRPRLPSTIPKTQKWRQTRVPQAPRPTPLLLNELADTRPCTVKTNTDGTKACVRTKGLSAIRLRLSQPLPPAKDLRSLRINRTPSGTNVDLVHVLPSETGERPGPAAGIYMGVNERLTLSTETPSAQDRSTAPRRKPSAGGSTLPRKAPTADESGSKPSPESAGATGCATATTATESPASW